MPRIRWLCLILRKQFPDALDKPPAYSDKERFWNLSAVQEAIFMGKYKVCVYTIAKNEEQFVRRWVESMQEADGIFVLDTGSTDHTVELLQDLGVHVFQEEIRPWRFDAARNRSLELIPEDYDICACMDLDEFFTPGWREELERVWHPDATRASYRYVWNYLPDGREGTIFWPNKIHARHGYRWRNPVHEVLTRTVPTREVFVTMQNVTLEHHADPNKSRGQYLPLLELSVQENPHDDRGMHYLGREYMFYGRHEDCIRTLKKHLAMPEARWDAERCASMRYIARSYAALGNPLEAKRWLLRAIAEAPFLREPYVELAMQFYEEKNWIALASVSEMALAIQKRPQVYVNDPVAWGETPYDLAALAWYHLGNYDRALKRGQEAVSLAPEDKRLRRNLEYYRSHAQNSASLNV